MIKKKRSLIAALMASLTISTFMLVSPIEANAASLSSSSNNEYSKEKIETRRPGFNSIISLEIYHIADSLDDIDKMHDGFNVIKSDPNKVVYKKNGQFISGWIKEGYYWYYSDPETHFIVRSQAKLIDGKEYYFLADGTMASNCNIEGSFYGKNGAKELNSININYPINYLIYRIKDRNDYWYMFTSQEIEQLITEGKIEVSIVDGGDRINGYKQTLELIYTDKNDDDKILDKYGWHYNVDNKSFSYYMNGDKVTGWKQIYCTDGPWYYFDANGIMKTGEQQIDGSWYYFNINGTMLTGWRQEFYDWYYYNQDGTRASNTTVDGYKIGANGYYCK